MISHPDRRLVVLGPVQRALAADPGRQPPAPGAADCRIDLKLLQWRALQAATRSPVARTKLQAWDQLLRPDLWAGTVQDGVARGFAVALEEVIAAAPPAPIDPPPPDDPVRMQTFTGSALRKKKDLLVDSGGARVRFSRKEGVLLVDRRAGVTSPNCLRFEARADHGTLDGFRGDERERPRLFSAQFLQPLRYTTGAGYSELVLDGRLGRRPDGFACRLVLTGRADEHQVRLSIRIDNRHQDHRLRARFLGVPAPLIEHHCTDVGERIDNDAGGFCAFTLVRACGRLLVDGAAVPVPAAQCPGVIEHEFRLGLDRGAGAGRHVDGGGDRGS